MNRIEARNPSNVAFPVFGGIVAAAAGLTTADASATGIAVDQLAVVAGKKFEGVLLTLPIQQILDSGQSLVVGLALGHCTASGGTYSDLATANTTIQNTGTATGVTKTGVAKLSTSIVGAKRWLRANVQFTGSVADTGGDRNATVFELTFFGPDYGPAA